MFCIRRGLIFLLLVELRSVQQLTNYLTYKFIIFILGNSLLKTIQQSLMNLRNKT